MPIRQENLEGTRSGPPEGAEYIFMDTLRVKKYSADTQRLNQPR